MGHYATSLPEHPPSVGRLAVDAHVHFHARERVADTLDAAISNFGNVRAAGKCDGSGALLLAQNAGERVFEWLREQARVGDWSVSPAECESQSLWLRSRRGQLVVVCGRQVIAERGLEVLALGTVGLIEDGLGLERTLAAVHACGALAVLPWGFGKWRGERAQRIRAQLQSPSIADLWAGDNGGRLQSLPRPPLLAEAEAHGVGVLPGTDPFPFGNDYRRVGNFGFIVEVTLDPARPWQSVRAALAEQRRSPPAYGKAAGWLEFLFKQTWIQVDKRLRRRSA
jgi:hypothetical protein